MKSVPSAPNFQALPLTVDRDAESRKSLSHVCWDSGVGTVGVRGMVAKGDLKKKTTGFHRSKAYYPLR